MAQKPIIAIPLGDAAGVGPEITAKALLDEQIASLFRPLIIGQRWVLERAFTLAGRSLPIRVIASAGEAAFAPGVIDLIEVGRLDPAEVAVGRVAASTGKEGAETLAYGARLVGEGKAHGLVSAPINKAACGLAGYGHGHMEIVADALGCKADLYSLLAGPKLKVINLTGHCSVIDAIRSLNPDRIVSALRVTHDWYVRLAGAQPRIAVCAVNPHAGDSGVFGREEIDIIAPAVTRARELGIDARGPLPVDTLFARVLEGDYDVVLSMYHDQGFTPVKTVGLHDTASLGVGLPIPYATTDHGTGFDLAGKGIANPGSLKQAIRVVVEMCSAAKA